MPNFFLLTWNPDRFRMDWEEESRLMAADVGRDVNWSTGGRRGGIAAGDVVFLLRQVRERGIIACGTALGEVYEGPHWDKSVGGVANYVDVDWKQSVDVEDRLPIEELQRIAPGTHWAPQASGIQVGDPDASALWDAWRAHLGVTVQEARAARPAEEVAEDEPVIEGAVRRIAVNRYERSPVARRECLDEYGTSCVVCGFDFGKRYGELGDGFIHVHHLVDIASVGAEYEVNGIKDLRPVCPNCHAMLHRTRPAMGIDELRGHLQD